MAELELKFEDFVKYASKLVGSIAELPYAISDDLNRAVANTREVLINETWPHAVQVRSGTFLKVALQRGIPARKDDLQVSIIDTLGRGNLLAHADGGTSRPKRAARLAIPVGQNVKRTSQGVTSSQLPANLTNSFVRGDAIFQRQGKRGVKKMYTLRASVPVPADVPFRRDFIDTMRQEMEANLPVSLIKALVTSNR